MHAPLYAELQRYNVRARVLHGHAIKGHTTCACVRFNAFYLYALLYSPPKAGLCLAHALARETLSHRYSTKQ